ncbi:MAG TPA: AAA family ATPase, partial [Gammaproteobacteria bacterium]|nr:AAA family ATPase [Gammaproteobacteria bacterium]
MREAEAIQQFRDAMRAAGLKPPDVIEPGKMHRFPGIGKRNGNTAGWCKLFADGMGGVFGDWAKGFSETWQAQRNRPFTESERQAFKRQCEQARQERQADQERQHAEARKRAERIWHEAKRETGAHRYLRDKGVSAYGIRTDGYRLIIPMRDVGGILHNLQFIELNGDKRYLQNGRVRGCYFGIGKQPDGLLCICEGYATGASIHEATGHAVAVAFNAGNLKAVAEALWAKYPDMRLVICADDDQCTNGNPGLTKATTAAHAVNGLLATPDYGDHRPAGATDFNDLHQHCGLDAVRACIDNAKAPASDKDQSSSGNAPNSATAKGIEAKAIITCAADVKPELITWLWPGRIAIGKLSIIAGDPGLGKSMITIAMATHVTRGTPWPVDLSTCPIGDVLMLSAEDDPADTIRPRLDAAGADVKRVRLLSMIRDVDSHTGEITERS